MLSRVLPAFLVLASLPALIRADSVLLFDNLFVGAVTPDGPSPWARLTVSDLAPGVVGFKLDNLTPVQDTNKLKTLWLNLDPFAGGVTMTSTGGVAATGFALNKDSVNGAGSTKWDAKLEFKTSGIGFSGGQFASWTLAGQGLSSSTFASTARSGGSATPHYAMIHMLSIGMNEQSTHVTATTPNTAVPGPAAALPFLVGLAGIRRRRARG